MSIRRTLLTLLCAALCGSPPVLASTPPSTVEAPHEQTQTHAFRHLRTVVLDPGHGGSNHGCLGVNGTWEKELTLEIAQRVHRILLEETTATPLLTRADDRPLGLRARAALANAWEADVFLSIHANADPRGAGHGVETWFLSEETADAEAKAIVAREETDAHEEEIDASDPTSGALRAILTDVSVRRAQIASEALAGAIVRGMQKKTRATLRGVKQARFGVLKGALLPAIVVETGFFSHRWEGLRLLRETYQERIARGIVDGLKAYDQRLGGVADVVDAGR